MSHGYCLHAKDDTGSPRQETAMRCPQTTSLIGISLMTSSEKCACYGGHGLLMFDISLLLCIEKGQLGNDMPDDHLFVYIDHDRCGWSMSDVS